jgi:S1-C subfamily serine protease
MQVGWLQATVPIENEWGHRGTGFLVTREIEVGRGRVFLVTNKHVVHTDPKIRAGATRLRCHFNTRVQDGTPGTLAIDIALRLGDGVVYREHPDEDTDVLAVHVTDVIVANPEIEKRWARYGDFGDRARREEHDITVGEDVVTIGYPLGLRQGKTNLPLLRQGMIATRIGDVIHDRVVGMDGRERDRALRAFLVDGGFVPGSSGSPVVLKPVIGRHVKGDVVLGTAPALLLGIVAETKYAPIKTDAGAAPSFAGLGLVFESETIQETIEEFFRE